MANVCSPQASTIASPTPQSHNRSMRKDIANLQLHEDGRGTPLPQYEKTQTVPFTLTLQEEKDKPGRFQLVVNIDPQQQKPSEGSPPKPAASKKLYANLTEIPSLGYDVSSLYQTQKSSPPSSPQEERQGWSDLDAIPPDFLQKVVPDWQVTFSRSDSTASSQSRKLADIKARIKKSGKGFVVRLLKGSSAGTNEVAEVHLGQQGNGAEPALQELDSHPRAELDASEAATTSLSPQSDTVDDHPAIFEIGTSNEPGIQRRDPQRANRLPSVPHWLSQATSDARSRVSVSEEGFSDAETLIPDVRSIADRLEEQTDLEPFSRNSSVIPTRTASVSSIVKTPTRGLSVVGPVKRVDKGNRVRGKGKAPRSDLNRSGAHKSVKRRSPRGSASDFTTIRALEHGEWLFRSRESVERVPLNESSDEQEPNECNIWQHPVRENDSTRQKARRRSSADELSGAGKPRVRLRLQTDVPRPKSANTSPVTRRKRSPRTHKPTTSSSSVHFVDENQQAEPSPLGSDVDQSDKLRKALEVALGPVPDDGTTKQNREARPIPRIEEPISEENVGEIPLPPELEIRPAPTHTRSPTMTFWGLVLSALSEKASEGIRALRERYGSEPPVPPNHVRVRWICVSPAAFLRQTSTYTP